ncbi:MAG: hypothetical protein QM767_16870 [Anaeromyxobacter sp.]
MTRQIEQPPHEFLRAWWLHRLVVIGPDGGFIPVCISNVPHALRWQFTAVEIDREQLDAHDPRHITWRVWYRKPRLFGGAVSEEQVLQDGHLRHKVVWRADGSCEDTDYAPGGQALARA